MILATSAAILESSLGRISMPAVAFLLRIPTVKVPMLVTKKGQVTIPKHIRDAAGVAPGSEVQFTLEGGKIIITLVGTGATKDRRAKLKAAAAKVRKGFSPEFKALSANKIMNFLRGVEPAKRHRGS